MHTLVRIARLKSAIPHRNKKNAVIVAGALEMLVREVFGWLVGLGCLPS